jgi:hypothetical protein
MHHLPKEVLQERDHQHTSARFQLGVIRWVHELSKWPSHINIYIMFTAYTVKWLTICSLTPIKFVVFSIFVIMELIRSMASPWPLSVCISNYSMDLEKFGILGSVWNAVFLYVKFKWKCICFQQWFSAQNNKHLDLYVQKRYTTFCNNLFLKKDKGSIIFNSVWIVIGVCKITKKAF